MEEPTTRHNIYIMFKAVIVLFIIISMISLIETGIDVSFKNKYVLFLVKYLSLIVITGTIPFIVINYVDLYKTYLNTIKAMMFMAFFAEGFFLLIAPDCFATLGGICFIMLALATWKEYTKDNLEVDNE